MSKKVALVTGGNKGIGLAIVKALSRKFPGDVILAARNEKLGKEAVQGIGKENIKFLRVDICDDGTLKDAAAFLKSKYGGLDILVNNAAIMYPDDSTATYAEQAENTVRTNYFGTKATCDALMPLIRSGGRVVNVSSMGGFLGHIPSKELKAKLSAVSLTEDELSEIMRGYVQAAKEGKQLEAGWPTFANSAKMTYVVSKVGMSALTRILQRKVDKLDDVAVNHVHPGYVVTDMNRGKGKVGPEEGAKSSVYAALLPPKTDIRGKYIWNDCSLVDWVNGPMPKSW